MTAGVIPVQGTGRRPHRRAWRRSARQTPRPQRAGRAPATREHLGPRGRLRQVCADTEGEQRQRASDPPRRRTPRQPHGNQAEGQWQGHLRHPRLDSEGDAAGVLVLDPHEGDGRNTQQPGYQRANRCAEDFRDTSRAARREERRVASARSRPSRAPIAAPRKPTHNVKSCTKGTVPGIPVPACAQQSSASASEIISTSARLASGLRLCATNAGGSDRHARRGGDVYERVHVGVNAEAAYLRPSRWEAYVRELRSKSVGLPRLAANSQTPRQRLRIRPPQATLSP